jgi:hypothetical protein
MLSPSTPPLPRFERTKSYAFQTSCLEISKGLALKSHLLLLPVGRPCRLSDLDPLLPPHYRRSSLVRSSRSHRRASLLWASTLRRLVPFHLTYPRMVPVVAQNYLDMARATCTPDAANPVCSLPAGLSQRNASSLVLTSVLLSTRSSVVYLRSPSISSPAGYEPTFPRLLTTPAFDGSRIWWFDVCHCRPTPGGPPPSVLHIHSLHLLSRYSAHTARSLSSS